MDIKKRDFLALGAGLGMGLAASDALAQNPAAPPAEPRPRYLWSGKQPAGVDPNYKPRRINKAIELFEDGQPLYYVTWGPDGEGNGYEAGKKMAQTWADCICIDLEHACFDLADVRKFMARAGWMAARPAAATACRRLSSACRSSATAPNIWKRFLGAAQILACGVMGVDVCHARDPKAVAAAVQAIRYPFAYPGAAKARTDLPYDGEGLRGSGSQGFAARIWGINPNRYCRLADVWPLNPHGEIMLGLKIEDRWALDNVEKTFAVPGVTFAEWGPGRHGVFAQRPRLPARPAGAARLGIQHSRHHRPQCARGAAAGRRRLQNQRRQAAGHLHSRKRSWTASSWAAWCWNARKHRRWSAANIPSAGMPV